MDQNQEQKDAARLEEVKKPYEAPKAVKLGTVEDLTQVSGPGGGSQVGLLSDRNVKANFATVDSHEVLEKLAQLPITAWNYKKDSAQVRHIGPMAQDFAKAFGLGSSDRVIELVDSSGVTMTAIQALYKIVLEQNERIAALDTEVRELRQLAAVV